jgi:hypothetical protein
MVVNEFNPLLKSQLLQVRAVRQYWPGKAFNQIVSTLLIECHLIDLPSGKASEGHGPGGFGFENAEKEQVLHRK